MADASMGFTFSAGYPEDVECGICLSPWTFPAEVTPCGHIFCRDCATGQTACPSCRGPVTALKDPNRVLRNIVNSLSGSCSACGWQGTRGSFLDSHTPAHCARVKRDREAAQQQRSVVRVASFQNLDVSPSKQASTPPPVRGDSDTLSGGESASRFMDFFVAPTAAAAATAPVDPHNRALASSNGSGGALATASAAPNPNPNSTPHFASDVTLAVIVVTSPAEAAPPLRFHTIAAPLDACSLEAIYLELCPEVMMNCSGAIPAVAVSGDRILQCAPDLSLAAQNVTHGSTLYVLCNGTQIATNIELFRVRSVLDNMLRDLRVLEASNRRHSVAEHRLATEELVRLSLRLDRLDRLEPEFRMQRWQTCVDAGDAEEIIDRVKPASLRQSPSVGRLGSGSMVGQAAAPGAADVTDSSTGGGNTVGPSPDDQPWIMYNVSQRFYDMIYAAFAQFDEDNCGTLAATEVRRTLRWVNLPYADSCIVELFAMFDLQTSSDRMPLHHLLVWAQGKQRRPLHDYGLSFQRYFDALDCFHALDRDLSGGLKPSEAVNFLCIFGGSQRAEAVEVVESLVQKARAVPLTDPQAANRSLLDRAEATGFEMDPDELLRVLAVEEQGWDVCQGLTIPSSAAPAPASQSTPTTRAAAPPPATSQRARASTSSARPAFDLQTTSTGVAQQPGASTHHDLRRSRSSTGGPQQKKDCIVA